ncbi:MAG: hypothetical protein HYX33_01400 [Actinobacteria bacterium]|nr:hypothetical protein [Actinomycetota bacterium]
MSRGLADTGRPGRNHELHRIASWEARHIIVNGGELGLIGLWLRAAGSPPPTPIPPDGPNPLRVVQAARLVLMLGPDDLPGRGEHLRRVVQAVARCGGWGEFLGAIAAADFASPDGRRALRSAVTALYPKALTSRRTWASLRQKAPRLPDWDVLVGAPAGDGAGGDRPSPSRRRRRRRLRTAGAPGAPGAVTSEAPERRGDRVAGPESAQDPAVGGAQPPRRRRRRRRGPRLEAVTVGTSGTNGATPGVERVVGDVPAEPAARHVGE